MNIILYGLAEETVRPLAARYGLRLCGSFERFEAGDCILIRSGLATDGERIAFYEEMLRHRTRIDAVVAVSAGAGSAVHYGSPPDKFFTVDNEADPDEVRYQLARIIEVLSGRICAHEF